MDALALNCWCIDSIIGAGTLTVSCLGSWPNQLLHYDKPHNILISVQQFR